MNDQTDRCEGDDPTEAKVTSSSNEPEEAKSKSNEQAGKRQRKEDKLLPPSFPWCKVDPEVDHRFAYNTQGEIDILLSPFYDPDWEYEESMKSYVNRILYCLAKRIEYQQPKEPWLLVGRSTSSSPPATSPANKALRATCLVVASL
ncbi:hypothetical protein MA16_Dca002985 [Dendrobium catenatum]|uniref:Uncharacterized protein n=1 Tax=Dendrobium catenatum TaxID=906689 RepID=A0A2I0X996_9ASPA|nr:hypothetical protein MA16_Dca002985 [Dendrobium catenatum]